MEKLIMVGEPEECVRCEAMLMEAGCDKVIVAYSYEIRNHHTSIEINGKQIFSHYKAAQLCMSGEVDGLFIISLTYAYDVWLDRIIEYFERKGVKKIYAPPAVEFKKKYFDDLDILFNKDRQSKRTHLQMLLTNKCNLNCKNCSHFSPLVKESEFYGLENAEKDLRRFAELEIYFDEIHLIGGEPLLYPYIPEILTFCKKYYPTTRVLLATNGLLLDSMSEEWLQALEEYRVFVSITRYQPIEKKLDKVIDLLLKKNIHFSISEEVQQFAKIYTSTPQEPKLACERCGAHFCTQIVNGKISRCYFPLVAKYFNEYYGQKYFQVEDSYMDIHTHSAEEIFYFIKHPMKACRYCGEKRFEKWDLFSHLPNKEIPECWLL